jgi:predicted RNA polymerase sigma factor
VASRKLTDLLRSDQARSRREYQWQVIPDAGPAPDQDDSLVLLLMCCHPSLTIAAQIALTLRAVGG